MRGRDLLEPERVADEVAERGLGSEHRDGDLDIRPPVARGVGSGEEGADVSQHGRGDVDHARLVEEPEDDDLAAAIDSGERQLDRRGRASDRLDDDPCPTPPECPGEIPVVARVHRGRPEGLGLPGLVRITHDCGDLCRAEAPRGLDGEEAEAAAAEHDDALAVDPAARGGTMTVPEPVDGGRERLGEARDRRCEIGGQANETPFRDDDGFCEAPHRQHRLGAAEHRVAGDARRAPTASTGGRGVDAHPVAGSVRGHTLPDRDDGPGDLVTMRPGEGARPRGLGTPGVEVRRADAARLDANDHLAGAGGGNRNVPNHEDPGPDVERSPHRSVSLGTGLHAVPSTTATELRDTRPVATLDRIGVSLWTMQSSAAAPTLWRSAYRRFAESARVAEDIGFHAVWVGEHRLWYDGWCPAPWHALAFVAGRTERIRLGTAMYLVPQHDPHAAAATIAALDELSGGRVEVGAGLGYRDPEFDVFGLRRDRRGRLMDGNLDTIEAIWRGEHDDIAPVRRTAPPIWMGGFAGPAIARAARRGYNLLLPQTLKPHEVARTVAEFRELGGTGAIGMLRELWVGDDAEAGERHRTRVRLHFSEEIGSWFPLRDRFGFEDRELVDKQAARGASQVAVGSATRSPRSSRRSIDAGVEYLGLRPVFEFVEPDELHEQLRRIAGEVAPLLRGLGT